MGAFASAIEVAKLTGIPPGMYHCRVRMYVLTSASPQGCKFWFGYNGSGAAPGGGITWNWNYKHLTLTSWVAGSAPGAGVSINPVGGTNVNFEADLILDATAAGAPFDWEVRLGFSDTATPGTTATLRSNMCTLTLTPMA